MSGTEQQVDEFFLALQRNVNAFDVAAIAQAFAPVFVVATPDESHAQPNDETLTRAIEHWLQLLRQAAIRDVKALQIDPTVLSDSAALVRVRWSIWFTPQGRPDFVNEVLFDYVVALRDAGIEIVTVIVHDDDAALRQLMGLAA